MDNNQLQNEIRRALGGDDAALTRLVDLLTPVVQARVARGLLRRRVGLAAGRDVRQEVEDISQEIFLALFEDDAKVLRSWEPRRGLSLENFVGLVAERQTASILRSGKRSPWKEDPTLVDELDRRAQGADPEDVAASREELRMLVERLREKLSPLGRHLFELLYLRELSVAEVAEVTDMSADAVYQWRSRLRRQAQNLFHDLSDSSTSGRNSVQHGGGR